MSLKFTEYGQGLGFFISVQNEKGHCFGEIYFAKTRKQFVFETIGSNVIYSELYLRIIVNKLNELNTTIK